MAISKWNIFGSENNSMCCSYFFPFLPWTIITDYDQSVDQGFKITTLMKMLVLKEMHRKTLANNIKW